MPELMGVAYMRSKLAKKHSRVNLRYKFYEMKNVAKDFQISTPPQLQWVHGSLGWCGKAVDVMADRLCFRGFKSDSDDYNLEEIFLMNNPDTFFDSAITSALIASCCFVYISKGKDDDIRLQVIDGGNATGAADPITGLLTEGYAVLDRNDKGQPILEAYFEPYKTTYYRVGEEPEVITNNVPYPLLVPIIHRPDDRRPFGHSRISRACMFYQDAAIRTIKRSEIGAEFYSFPQKYVTGLSQDAEIDKWQASMSALITLEKDDDGDSPSLGQFATQSMGPHIDQLKMIASLFAGETGLTLEDLGFSSGNPASYDAIKASHENLRLAARKAQRCFGTGFLNVGMVAACLRDDFLYERKSFLVNASGERREIPTWYPMFEPDVSALSGIGDALIKLEQAAPGYVTEERLEELLGI